jgi:hypothetical protein
MAAMEAMDSHGPAGWFSMLFLSKMGVMFHLAKLLRYGSFLPGTLQLD